MAPTLSRLGSVNAAVGTYAQDNALFLEIYGQEVITSFERSCIFQGMFQERTISEGKSARFPVIGRLTAGYYTPGTEVTGQGTPAQNEVIIYIDQKLISAVVLDEVEELKVHWDQRQIYSMEMGQAMAREHDKRLARMLCLGARIATSDLTADLPSGLSPDDPFRTGTRVDLANATPTPDDYVAALFAAKQALNEKDIPFEGRTAVLTPEVHSQLAQSTRALNTDFNNGSAPGTYREGNVAQLASFTLAESNHIAQGNVTAAAGEEGYSINGSLVKLSSVNMTTTRALCFRRDALGVLNLRGLTTQMTGNDYATQYQAVLLLAKYVKGYGVLRPESCVEIYNSL